MVHLPDQAFGLGLRVIQRLVNRIDGRRREFYLLKQLQQVAPVMQCDGVGHDALHRLTVAHAIRIRRKARIVANPGKVKCRHQPACQPVVRTGNKHPLCVGTFEVSVGCDCRVGRTHALRHFTAEQIALRLIIEHADGRAK